MAGALTVDTLNSSTGVLATQNGMTGVAKAWVNFNGTGTIAIRDSFNVSSITDNGTGRYAINFTTAMPNANYGASVSVSSMPAVSDANLVSTDCNNTSRANPTTSVFSITTYNASFSPLDMEFVRVAIFSS
jgi:hypothetical protein